MHKIYFTLLLGLTALFIAGCGAGPGSAPTQVGEPSAMAASATSTAWICSPTAAPDKTATVAGATSTATVWEPPTALVGTPIAGAVATLTAAPRLKMEKITLVNRAGERAEMTVEIADTEPSRQLGLMFRPSMDIDAGMLFDFNVDTTEGFWMQNTILPLSIGFIQADGTLISVQDMQPLDTSTTGASGPYRYALETNQGYFRVHNLQAGDKVTFGEQTVALPGMPGCTQK